MKILPAFTGLIIGTCTFALYVWGKVYSLYCLYTPNRLVWKDAFICFVETLPGIKLQYSPLHWFWRMVLIWNTWNLFFIFEWLVFLNFVIITLFTHDVGYLMCLFEEKLDDDVLEKLQDFEFAVSNNILLLVITLTQYIVFLLHMHIFWLIHSSPMKIKTARNFSIALQRQGNWITFLEMYITKFLVSKPSI